MASAASSAARSTWRRRVRTQAGGEAAALSPAKYPSWLVGGCVERRRWDDPEVADFLRAGVPVVLTGGCPLTRGLVGKWDFDYLAEGFGADFKNLAVHFAPRDKTSAFTRHYGKGLGAGGVRTMSFPGFVELARSESLAPREGRPPSPYRYYLQVPMLWDAKHDKGDANQPQTHKGALAANVDAATASAEAPLSKAPFNAAVERDLSHMGWDWLAGVRDASGCVPFDTCQLWAGHGGGSTPLHFDSLSNLLCQVKGSKRVLLFSPAQTWNIYPYPVGHQMDNFAMIDVERPDTARFPGLKRARGLEAVLEPGDVLWLPRFHWHYVHQMGEAADGRGAENISLNFWIGRKGTDGFLNDLRHSPLPPAAEVSAAAAQCAADFDATYGGDDMARLAQLEAEDDGILTADGALAMHCLHAGRMIESAATTILNGDAALGGAFLAAMAGGAEARWAQELPQTQKALRIRTELMALLGTRAANALFRMVSRDGRLHPGLAAPVEGTIVNSEKGGVTSQEDIERMLGVDRAQIGVASGVVLVGGG